MDEINKQKLDKNEILEIVKKMIGFMNIDCQVEASEEPGDGHGEGAVVISIQTQDNARFLIGKNGQNLKAFEHVVRVMLVKEGKDATIVIDVNDYRKSRTAYLVDAAKQTVARVRNTQKAEALFPMTAYERRVVHMELAAYPDIATESIGTEPQRRVIIKPL
ncbi:MAG: hypothetical protein A3J47_03320 [Candidatus Yanofskybacteria bacterium RIFCSPHIGHO2_02_FULL_43_22]|uniref:R3H domain-containing protein n=1 Tax=Candidatus Yanofskybacteria bacterium RIFCSPHIGHO2_02_FULL_43_22 TaxID=1802681 RepID=A0A1F8FU66_9BACT|nr:MAG: hypothetical protein A3J47_03320 [Candidatus Yanofskybacteria bacterium RIFCSPHIGHO2_02_FULL_43_22]